MPLTKLFTSQSPDQSHYNLPAVITLFEALCCQRPAMTDERREVCRSLAAEVQELITRWDAYRGHAWYRGSESRVGIPESLIHACDAIDQRELLDHFTVHFLDDKGRYGLHEVLIPAVKAVAKWIQADSPAHAAHERLRENCQAALQSLTASPIEPPKDWTRDADLGCKCPDCQALAKFLRDPDQRVGRFPLRKDRRQHLHRQIDGHKIDLLHVTERKGSPQTLVCTKTQASYERRLAQYQVDCQLLEELEKLGSGRVPKPAALAKRSSKKFRPSVRGR